MQHNNERKRYGKVKAFRSLLNAFSYPQKQGNLSRGTYFHGSHSLFYIIHTQGNVAKNSLL